MENIKKNKVITEDTVLFSTGVYLKPQRIEINGKFQWRWISVGFEDSSFLDGDEIEVYDYSDKVENLLIPVE